MLQKYLFYLPEKKVNRTLSKITRVCIIDLNVSDTLESSIFDKVPIVII